MLLQTHTHFSLCYGALSAVDLLREAAERGYSELALTDINNTSAGPDFVRLAPKFGIRPVLGIDFRTGARPEFVGLARNNEGYAELCTHLSERLCSGRTSDPLPVFRHATVVFPLAHYRNQPLGPGIYVGLRLEDLLALRRGLIALPPEHLVLMHPFSFRHRRDFNVHRLLRCIDLNCLLSKLPEGEAASVNDSWRSASDVEQALEGLDFLRYNTLQLLRSCSIHFEFSPGDRHHNLKSYTGNEALDFRLMKHLCVQNLRLRYPNPDARVLERIEMELDIIRQKRFVSYFLINWKILKYARSKGYFYVGRGSGANSAVAYLLRITDVDPIELDLFFERFINLHRINPPDFDIDFSWADRDDVTRFIFERFPHVALLGTYVTFQFKGVVRELGKVFGLPPAEIDKLGEARAGGALAADDPTRWVLSYGALIQDFPKHLGIHAGGILITDRPLSWFCACFLPPKGFPTAQIDMVVAEDLGIYKFDILSQRGLGKIRDALELIRTTRPDIALPDIHDIGPFRSDPLIRSMLSEGRAIGCFYVESPAMRMLMRKLRVNDYLGLVAASSVIRPGVAKSGMMREYILRYRDPQRRAEAHPRLLELMPETFGVMVYQEDVLKVAHYFAGMSLGEADVLRRGMSGKFRGREEFESARRGFFEGCASKGHDAALSAEVWRQVESFAGYAFAKGHSASYAVESYQSLYLKAHFPLEYMVATLNNGGGFYSPELYLHEARMLGAEVLPPCVNRSEALCSLDGHHLYLGLGMLKGLESQTLLDVLEERRQNGVFDSLEDLIRRVPMGIEQLRLLIRIGALRSLHKTKQQLLWEAYALLGRRRPDPERTLFDTPSKPYRLPELESERIEDAYDEIELLGFPLCDPFDLYSFDNELLNESDLNNYINKEIRVAGYLVTAKTTRTSRGQRMMFGNFIDRKGFFIDTVHFPETAARYPFRGRGVYAIRGRVSEEFDCLSIEVQSMEKCPMHPDPRYRDAVLKRPEKRVKA
ncbi:PHP domain-containing protein [bacterium]|nr:PHP domain-containing protein [bacterium]